MSRILYWECSSGISGDMAVASLLDAGADERVLRDVLASIPAEGFEIEIGRVKKAGLDCCDFTVKLDKEHENHDHDMEYLHGSLHEGGHAHSHGGQAHEEHGCSSHMESDGHARSHDETAHSHEEHAHSNDEEEHSHGEHAHSHEHRNLRDVTDIINHTDMTPKARQTALRIFNIVAESEAKAHGTDKEHVHFHEVGAIDSIVDIVAAAVCLDNLGIDKVCVTEVCEGYGTVRCQHGVLPIPVPAVCAVLEKYNIAIKPIGVSGEFVTPTGAAIVAAVRTTDRLPEKFTIKKTGIGAGKREYERPSILRAMIIEEDTQRADFIYKLESNIDDCTGEAFGYVMERLFEAGARDVSYSPVYMKKNRPGWLLTVICKEEDIESLEKIIFFETTTIGIRRQKMQRSILERATEHVQTELGSAQVKVVRIDGENIRCYPEYESVSSIAKETGRPFFEVYELVKNTAVRAVCAGASQTAVMADEKPPARISRRPVTINRSGNEV